MLAADFQALYDSYTLEMATANARMLAARTPERGRNAQADYCQAQEERRLLVENHDPEGLAQHLENDRNHVGASHYGY